MFLNVYHLPPFYFLLHSISIVKQLLKVYPFFDPVLTRSWAVVLNLPEPDSDFGIHFAFRVTSCNKLEFSPEKRSGEKSKLKIRDFELSELSFPGKFRIEFVGIV
jgi:hypothetical protein